jgi:hypothetical protein
VGGGPVAISAGGCPAVVARGWNTDYGNPCLLLRRSVLPGVFSRFPGGGRGRGGGCGLWVRCWVSEGTGGGLLSLSAGWVSYRHAVLWWVALWLLVVGLLFEICIVDASIFFLGFCV